MTEYCTFLMLYNLFFPICLNVTDDFMSQSESPRTSRSPRSSPHAPLKTLHSVFSGHSSAAKKAQKEKMAKKRNALKKKEKSRRLAADEPGFLEGDDIKPMHAVQALAQAVYKKRQASAGE
jgi:hypothetical protein